MHLKDLAFRFGFKSVSHVSVLFQQWIFMLSKVLGSLITWPSCRNVKQNLPNGFKEKAEFRAIRCILDCTEFAIQAPSALSLNAMNYSYYKCCHTVKVLCSITPDGYFSFVSTAFPSSISDNAFTIQSGLLDLCEPGDSLLADKGLTVSNAELQPRGLTKFRLDEEIVNSCQVK